MGGKNTLRAAFWKIERTRIESLKNRPILMKVNVPRSVRCIYHREDVKKEAVEPNKSTHAFFSTERIFEE
jgi:hypothetical protein